MTRILTRRAARRAEPNPSRSRRPRRARLLALVAGTAVVAIVSATAAHAVWSQTATASGSVAAGRVQVAVTSDLNRVVRNSNGNPTGPVTVTNTTASTSTQKASVAIDFKATGLTSSTLGWVWPTTNPALCTEAAALGDGVKVGVWDTGFTYTADIAPGQSQTFCARILRTANMATPTGTMTINATVTATASVGSFRASATAKNTISTLALYPSASPTTDWYRMKPLGQNLCVDVNGGSNARPGALVGTYTCYSGTAETYANQWIAPKYHLSNSTTVTDLAVKMPAGVSLQRSGTAVAVQTTNHALVSQQWYTQVVATDTYQFVAADTGMCLTAPASSGNLTMARCDDLATQKFVVSRVGVAAPLMAELSDLLDEAPGAEAPGDGATGEVTPSGEQTVDPTSEEHPPTPGAEAQETAGEEDMAEAAALLAEAETQAVAAEIAAATQADAIGPLGHQDPTMTTGGSRRD